MVKKSLPAAGVLVRPCQLLVLPRTFQNYVESRTRTKSLLSRASYKIKPYVQSRTKSLKKRRKSY